MDKNNRNFRNNSYFRDFYSEDKVKSKLEKKELVKGTLINEGHKWFVEVDHKKIYINSEKDRNRAFNKDSVVVEVDPKNKESGRIVYIYDPLYKKLVFEGKVVNEIKNENKKSSNSLFFIPNDRDVPYFEIKFDSIDIKVLSINKFKKDYESFRGNRYEAQIVDWNSRFKNPLGTLIKNISGNNNKNNYREPQKTSSGGMTISLIKDSSNNTIRKVDTNGNANVDRRKSLRNSRSSNFKNKDRKYSRSNLKSYYETFLSKGVVDDGLKDKTLFKGKLYVDEWKGNSYVKLQDSEDKVIINSDKDRNRGLDGDEVVIKIIKEVGNDKIGKVVYIEKPSYKNKEVTGKMLMEVEQRGSDRKLLLFLCPKEKKLPKIDIPRNQVPKDVLKLTDFFKNINKYRNMNNFVGKINKWDENDKLPVGALIRNENGDLKELDSSEMQKIIEEVKASGTEKPFEALKIKFKVNQTDPNSYFERYYPKELVDFGVSNKDLFKGKVEILKNSDCFVILDDTEEKIIIDNKKKRNRSFHGDHVVVEILDSTTDKKTGKIVYIEDPVYFKDMKILGTIKYMNDSNESRSTRLIFYPDDKRIPLIDLPISQIDRKVLVVNDFIKHQEEFKDTYFNAKIIKYGNHRYNPLGELIEKTDSKKSNNDYYEKYLTDEEVEKGLADGTLYEGLIRVNSKNGSDSYVTVAGMDKDIRITSVKLRNRALDNDIVIVKLLDGEELQSSEDALQQKKEENKMKDEEMFEKFATKGVKLNDYIEEKNNPLGKIVCVRDSKAKNIDIVGKFKIDPERDYSKEERFIFYPNDKAIPLMDIMAKDIDTEIFDIKDFIQNPTKYEDTLIVARIIKWGESRCYPLGKIVSKLTDEHTIDSRTKIILKSYNVDDSAFYDLITKEVPSDDWQIPEEEIKNRLDLRQECIFTIDPPTARDLDDALSCKKLDDGTYEVGIHIADVSYFVHPDSNMDKEAFKRGTSTYLVQKVIPMLPRVLCENLCSLNAGGSRLAFSVIIKMDKDGHVLESKAAKSVICSCARLAYDHAQRVIDNNGEWPKENDDVVVSNPYHNYTTEDVRNGINELYRLSRIMKEERYANGAVSLNRKKLWFQLNHDDDLPLDFGIYQTREANSLVEEFMLLANTTVANMLYETYANESLLRCHEAPTPENVKKYLALIEFTKKLVINTSDSKAFHDSLISIKEAGSIYSDVALSKCIKFMKRANYICSSESHPEKLFHYGLHIPYYTHFTSPIRRYPDIIVHRQLQALLCKEASPYNSKDIKKIAKHSNDTKANAKKAQDDSNNLYLIYLLNDYLRKTNKEYIIEDALVIGFDNYYIEITLPKFAFEDKISINQLYEKDIVKGVIVSKPQSIEDNQEVIFDVFWNNDVNLDNILEKYNADANAENQKLEDIIKQNTSIDNFDSVDDEEFDSEEALTQAAEAAAAEAATEEEKMEKKKQDLSQFRKQTFKIFDSFKVLVIPNFDKMKINVLIAPPDIVEHDNTNESYEAHPQPNEIVDDSVVVFEPEGGYD